MFARYLAVAPPYITVYEQSGDVFDKMPNPDDLLSGNGCGVSMN